MVDIVFIGLVSVICGGTDFEHMEDTGYGKEEWFRERLELPNGIPGSDTFRRVFERLEPKELAEILQETVDVEGKVLAIDGKTICGSANGQHRAYHVVSAWVVGSTGRPSRSAPYCSPSFDTTRRMSGTVS